MQNAVQMVRNIEDAFCKADPEHKEVYQANAEAYIEKLNALDAELKEIVSEGSRRDIVFGGRFAYGYFIHGYGLEYESVYDSCSADTETEYGADGGCDQLHERTPCKSIFYMKNSQRRMWPERLQTQQGRRC